MNLRFAIGVAFDSEQSNACFAIIDHQAKRVRATTLSVSGVTNLQECLKDRSKWPDDLKRIRDELESLCNGSVARTTVAAQSAIVSEGSQLFTVVCLVASAGLSPFVYAPPGRAFDISGDCILVGMDLPKAAYIQTLPNALPLRLQWEPNCRAYARFVFGQDSIEGVAFATAIMGQTDGTYYFFRSAGEVRSSGDIVTFLGRKEMFKGLGIPETVEAVDSVIASTESFEMRLASGNAQTDTAALPRYHALSLARHRPKLGFRNGLKFALLETCRKYGITLKCASLRSEKIAVRAIAELKASEIGEDRPMARQIKDHIQKHAAADDHEVLTLTSIIESAERQGQTRRELLWSFFPT